MMARILPLLVLLATSLYGQTRLTIDQLRNFLKSSVDLHQPDKQVSEFLKRAKLTQRLEPRQFEEFIGMGVGARTVEVLRDWLASTKELPPAPAPVAATPKSVVAIPPPSPREQAKILEDAREYALNYSKRLPDFICTQVTRRYLDPSGLEFWRNMDTITARLSYFEQKEDYKVISVNGRMVDLPYRKLGGTTSSGEFGTMLNDLFQAQTAARFEWERWATLRGKRTHVFKYFVAQPNSRWTVTYETMAPIEVGYSGLVYVDRDTSQITRITLEADMPASHPIQMVTTLLDYDSIDISGSTFMLPLRAEVRSRSGKELTKNEVEFRLYRKFGADTSIKFDTPEPLPADATTEQPPKQ
jgi:hypothetical protein